MDASKKYTVADIDNVEKHIELVNGEMIIEDKTTSEHNEVVNEIVFALKSHIRANNGNCKVFSENVALYVNEMCDDEYNFFLPDVMVVCKKDAVDDKGVHKSPLFVSEVTSENTRINDYNTKLDIYKQIGVDEYWIVDLQRKVIYKYLKSEGYIPQTFMHPATVEFTVYQGLKINL